MLVNYEVMVLHQQRGHSTCIPKGHKRLMLNMVSPLSMPICERFQNKFLLSSRKSPASKSPTRKKPVPGVGKTSVGQEASSKNRKNCIEFDTPDVSIFFSITPNQKVEGEVCGRQISSHFYPISTDRQETKVSVTGIR